MVVEHTVREHERDGGEVQVDEYKRGEEHKVGRFSNAFGGLSSRFKNAQEEYARSKAEKDLALSREEYLSAQEHDEEARAIFEEQAYNQTHKAPLRQRIAQKGQAAITTFHNLQPATKPRKSDGRRARIRNARVPPGYAEYRGKLYRIPKGYSAGPARKVRKRRAPRQEGVYGENDQIYR